MTQIEIIVRPLDVGDLKLTWGDRFEPDELNLSDRARHDLRRAQYIKPLTRDLYAMLMQRHPAGHVGRGFTRKILVELGILDPAPRAELQAGETVSLEGAEKVKGGGYLIPHKRGIAPVYDIADDQGRLLSARQFRSREKALAALKDALAAAKRPKGASHGVQLQREPEHAD